MSPGSLRRVHIACTVWALAWMQSGTAEAEAEGARERVRVEVVEVAGQRAYVRPGADANLQRGDRVVIARRRYRVVAVSASAALIETGGARLKVGTRGVARVRPLVETAATRLPTPSPLSNYRGQWPQAPLPADQQHPDPVPLGQPVARDHRTVGSLAIAGASRIPLDDRGTSISRASLRARLHAEPLAPAPLLLDVDLASQVWFASDLSQRAGRDSRPPLRVYALTAQYGQARGAHAAGGRLRYAAASLGALDGVRLQAPLWPDGLHAAAFGGFVPAPLDGQPDMDTSRFGGELLYEDLEGALQPRVAVTAHGSRFEGALDEKRVQVQADLYPEDGYAGGYGLVSFFDTDNPWRAPRQELTAAGAHAGLWLGDVRVGGRFDVQRPERSRWLASFLPPQWLCVEAPAPPSPTGVAETCYGDQVRYLGQADVGLQLSRVGLDVGASVAHTTRVDAAQRAAFAHVRVLRIVERGRLDVTVSGSDGSVLRSGAVTIAPGIALGETFDLSLRYRPAVTRYVADTGAFFEQQAGASLRYSPRDNLDLSFDGDTLWSRDVRVLIVQVLSAWRI